MEAELGNQGYLQTRIMSWKNELSDARKVAEFRRLIHSAAPCRLFRSGLVRALARVETARAHLHALGEKC